MSNEQFYNEIAELYEDDLRESGPPVPIADGSDGFSEDGGTPLPRMSRSGKNPQLCRVIEFSPSPPSKRSRRGSLGMVVGSNGSSRTGGVADGQSDVGILQILQGGTSSPHELSESGEDGRYPVQSAANWENKRSRSWCFTLNNPEAGEVVSLENLTCRYIVWQWEKGSDGINGTLHLQGYVEFKNSKRGGTLKRFNSRAHWEPRRGTAKEASNYCQEEQKRVGGTSVFKRGECSRQGRRVDLEDIRLRILDGATPLEISTEYFSQWIHHRTSFGIYRQFVNPSPVRDWLTEPIVFWGLTGSGKSRKAREDYPNAYWLPQPNGKGTALWWPLYSGEEVVVVDEFYGWIQHSFLLRLLDRYALPVRCNANSSVQFLARKIVFTSNTHPDEWYANVPQARMDALSRRLTNIVHFDQL